MQFYDVNVKVLRLHLHMENCNEKLSFHAIVIVTPHYSVLEESHSPRLVKLKRDNFLMQQNWCGQQSGSALKGSRMDIIASNKLLIKVTTISNTATIYLSGHFSFCAHREFKAAYRGQLNNSKIGSIVVNFAEVEYLDSSALGMLLVLRDNVRDADKALVLSGPSPIVARVFEIARFDNMFTINR